MNWNKLQYTCECLKKRNGQNDQETALIKWVHRDYSLNESRDEEYFLEEKSSRTREVFSRDRDSFCDPRWTTDEIAHPAKRHFQSRL